MSSTGAAAALCSICPACGGVQPRLEFTVTREDRYRILNGPDAPPARYWECDGCGAMIFRGEDRSEGSYESGQYYEVEGDAVAFLERRFREISRLPPERSDNEKRVRRIVEFLRLNPELGRPQKILDVGAGMGVFLYRFISAVESELAGGVDAGGRWSATAVEPEPHTIQHLKRVLPECEIVQGLSSVLPSAHQFGVITLNRVLEHTPDPVALLKTEYGHLSEKGVLYIEVPDTLSYYHDGANNEAFGYTHFVVYSPDSLLRVARLAGLEALAVNRVVEPSGKFTLYGFFQRLRDQTS